MTDPLASFVLANTAPGSATLVPEIALHLARDPYAIFQAAERLALPAGLRYPPYWAFAWPGGQALARHLLDHPALVADRTVVDVGAGSGIGALAALQAGARQVTAIDVDVVAEVAIRLNADLNGLADRLATSTSDILATVPDAEVVLVSDLVYEPELELRAGAFLVRAADAGLTVLVGDRATARRPAPVAEALVRYRAPLMPPLEPDAPEDGCVWRVGVRRGTAGAPGRRPGASSP